MLPKPKGSRMKKCYTSTPLILILSLPFTLQTTPQDKISQQAISHDKDAKIVIHNHVTGSSSNATAHSENRTEQTSRVEQFSYSLLHSITSMVTDLQKTVPGYMNSIRQHKYKIYAATIGASYLYLQYQLHIVHTLLEDPTSWCNWKEIVSLQHLACAPHQDLIPELLADIQKKYLVLSKQNTQINKTAPFNQFINNVSLELTLLQQYATIQEWATFCCISKLFSFSYKKSMIQEKINRLHIMLDIFVTWQIKEFLK